MTRVKGITKPEKVVRIPCMRCGGCGIFAHYGKCFRCGGNGADPKERTWGFPVDWTDEEIVIWVNARDARNAKARERAAEKRAAEADKVLNENLAKYPGLAEAMERNDLPPFADDILFKARRFPLTEKQAAVVLRIVDEADERAVQAAERDAAKATKKWIAEIGDKVEVEVTVALTRTIDTQFGVAVLVLFETADGDVLKTFGTAAWLWDVEKGDKVLVKGTVKDLETYEGLKQTVLTRTKGEAMDKEAV